MDALRRLAGIFSAQNKPKESLEAWRQVSDILPRDASVLGALGAVQYSAGSFDDSEQTLQRAHALGLKTSETLETEARLHIRRNDYSGAIPVIEEALALNKDSQPLWLLRADCAHQLKRWPVESESLEHALTLGPIPLAATTNLIGGYLAAGQTSRALTYLSSASNIPPDAETRAQYAAFWEQAHNPAAAEPLWESSLTAAPTYEPAYLGLTQHYLDLHRNQDALKAADRGLLAIPKSVALLEAKENVLESLGDLYGARRLLRHSVSASAGQTNFLSHRCQLEDLHGSGGAQAYKDLLAAQLTSEAPQTRVIETCRRGLLVAIRDEHYGLGQIVR